MKGKSQGDILAARVKFWQGWAYKTDVLLDSIEEWANKLLYAAFCIFAFELVFSWPLLFLVTILKGFDGCFNVIVVLIAIPFTFLVVSLAMVIPLLPVSLTCKRIKDAKFKLYVKGKCVYCTYQMDEQMTRCPECGNKK